MRLLFPRKVFLYHFLISIFNLIFILITFFPTLGSDDPYYLLRKKMVEKDLKGRNITNKKVLEIMEKTPRHLFVRKDLMEVAYEDSPLPIGEGQTISQPYIVALMTQILDIKYGEKVLEIGTGSGYQAAILSQLTDKVYSIEIRKTLSEKARETLARLGYKNVKVKYGDGYLGWKEYSPFDAIIITAAVNHIPSSLLSQLRDGGRLLLPLGNSDSFQDLTLVSKKRGNLKVRHITGVLFVPMIGEGITKQK